MTKMKDLTGMTPFDRDLSGVLKGGLPTELINDIIEAQLELWPLAKANYERLSSTRRKPLSIGSLQGAAQWNPGRAGSTGASVDAKSISERKCFLCSENRPSEQFSLPWLEKWELLVNPFPILPVHFTIACKAHRPQAALPLDMAAMAEQAPDLAIFYNGAKSGASAPDHQHAQAVLKSELPLLRVAETIHPLERPGLMSSRDAGVELPFSFISAVISPDAKGMAALSALPSLGGTDPDSGLPSYKMMNTFFWMDGRTLRAVVVPRRAHRPECFGTAPGKMLVSPGAIDIAGILILPREEDFKAMNSTKAKEIYEEVCYPAS